MHREKWYRITGLNRIKLVLVGQTFCRLNVLIKHSPWGEKISQFCTLEVAQIIFPCLLQGTWKLRVALVHYFDQGDTDTHSWNQLSQYVIQKILLFKKKYWGKSRSASCWCNAGNSGGKHFALFFLSQLLSWQEILGFLQPTRVLGKEKSSLFWRQGGHTGEKGGQRHSRRVGLYGKSSLLFETNEWFWFRLTHHLLSEVQG